MKIKSWRLRRAAFCAFACCLTSAFADTPDWAAQTADLDSQTAELESRVISWVAPQSNDDGSVLDDLLGYYVYIGDSPDTMVPYTFTSALTQSWVYQFVPNGVHYLAVTAVNFDGVESEMSPTVEL